MKVLIKVGGTLLDSLATRTAIAAQLADTAREHELVVVHGGGKQVTRHLEERGVSSRFVGGFRVSDEAVVNAVTSVIGGTVNKQLVAALIAAGESAVGISGLDGMLTTATQLSPDLGAVGKPARTDPRLLNLLVTAGYLPVIACIAGDESGTIYNVNADQMAFTCAAGWQAELLLFLTDVPGVKGADGRIIPKLAPADIQDLIATGVAHGGMQAKLEAALNVLRSGLAQVIIASGHEPHVCRRALAGDRVGTLLSLISTESPQPELAPQAESIP